MYKILCKGIVVENYVPKAKLSSQLLYWKNNGMKGNYTYFKHTKEEMENRM